MTLVGLLGFWLYAKRQFRLTYALLSFYALTSLTSLGHYLFPAASPMTVKMHSLIALDVAAGMLLLGYVAWSLGIHREWAVQSRD
ncbi:MAG: hypothetical protein Q6L68_16010 [Thermostichus sp. DG02_5_bins_236]